MPMAGQLTNNGSFVFGVVRRPDIGYIVLSLDEMAEEKIPHSYMVQWHAGQFSNAGVLPWLTAGVSVLRQPIEQLLAVAEFGQVFIFGSGDKHEERIGTEKEGPIARGPLRGVRLIGKRAYVVGMDRQAYRRDGVNQWVTIDQGMRPLEGSTDVVGLEAVDGFSEEEIYAVGWDGAIWRYDGRAWTQADSPTNMILTDVCCAGDGNVYACARLGLLLRGRGDRWSVVEHESTEDDLWSMTWFQGRLYLSTMQELFVLENDKLEPVDLGDDPPSTCYRLSSIPDVLWSVGAKDAMAFDGTNWMRID
jgi:hypothetical protein